MEAIILTDKDHVNFMALNMDKIAFFHTFSRFYYKWNKSVEFGEVRKYSNGILEPLTIVIDL